MSEKDKDNILNGISDADKARYEQHLKKREERKVSAAPAPEGQEAAVQEELNKTLLELREQTIRFRGKDSGATGGMLH